MKLFILAMLFVTTVLFSMGASGAASQDRSINIAAQKRVVAQASARPSLVTSDCMGTTSAGVQGQFFGLTFSSSKQSEPCNRREDAKVWEWLGDHEKAIEVMNGEETEIVIEYIYPNSKE